MKSAVTFPRLIQIMGHQVARIKNVQTTKCETDRQKRLMKPRRTVQKEMTGPSIYVVRGVNGERSRRLSLPPKTHKGEGHTVLGTES
jgi:DNA-directed RNA polymerase subunit RPC12/RpoP